MQRFYFPNLKKIDESIVIKNMNFLNQLIKVLRVKLGDEFIFFNGVDDIDFLFKVINVDKREIYLEKIGENKNNSEIDFDLNIFSAMPNKIEKIEYLVAKAVEVGVNGFYFFRSKRSQKLILSENKIERLNKIIKEAVEQSGRTRIPKLIIEDYLDLSLLKENENIFFHTKDEKSTSLSNLKIDYNKGVNLFIGPEGGFCDEEVNIFLNLGFKKVYLGNRILRTETTPIVTSFYIIQNKK